MDFFIFSNLDPVFLKLSFFFLCWRIQKVRFRQKKLRFFGQDQIRESDRDEEGVVSVVLVSFLCVRVVECSGCWEVERDDEGVVSVVLLSFLCVRNDECGGCWEVEREVERRWRCGGEFMFLLSRVSRVMYILDNTVGLDF